MPVRHAILGLLEQRPRHGYELRSAFEALVGGSLTWELKPAQVYTTLQRLQEAGLIEQDRIEQDAGPEKRIYSVTEAGRAELKRWLSSAVPAEHERDAFFLKLMITLVTDGVEPYELLRVQRSRMFRELHDLTARRDKMNARESLAQMLLFDKAIMHLDADLRWLDMVEVRLGEIARQPLPRPLPRRRGRPPKGRGDSAVQDS